jgi:heat-inducible transcriptional repressor
LLFYAKTMNIETIQLTERRKQLLRAVIQEYVRTAQPVGSNNISHNTALAVSPATIRNDLAALEAQGLLTHPHTSAGRIPTDAGYRYFVHQLMPTADLPAQERSSVRNELALVRQDLDQWLPPALPYWRAHPERCSCHGAPFSAQPLQTHRTRCHLRRKGAAGACAAGWFGETTDLRPRSAHGAKCAERNEQRTERPPQRLDAGEVEGALQKLTPFAQQVALLVASALHATDSQLSGQIYRDGLAQILEQPEFADGDPVRRIVRVFEERSLLEQIVGELGSNSDVRILIAGDGRVPELRDISLVISRYGVEDRATGMLGVVGPVRMAYGRSVSAVRFVAALMSEIVEEMYGP